MRCIVNKWDQRFLELAKHVSTWSKDPSTQTGAVIVNLDNTVVGLGYNGFPRGIEDSHDRLYDRETKYSMIIHCEMNAVLHANQSVSGCTLYTWPFMSCDRCAAHMIQAGIKRAVAPKLPNHLVERWEPVLVRSRALFSEAGIILDEVDFPLYI